MIRKWIVIVNMRLGHFAVYIRYTPYFEPNQQLVKISEIWGTCCFSPTSLRIKPKNNGEMTKVNIIYRFRPSVILYFRTQILHILTITCSIPFRHNNNATIFMPNIKMKTGWRALYKQIMHMFNLAICWNLNNLQWGGVGNNESLLWEQPVLFSYINTQ